MKIILPDTLLFGYWASAPFPWLIIVAKSHKNNAALIAHESCHQEQQRRDGVITFWWRYLTNKSWRLAYEVDAFHVQYKVKPADLWKYGHWLANNYGLNLSIDDALEMIKAGTV